MWNSINHNTEAHVAKDMYCECAHVLCVCVCVCVCVYTCNGFLPVAVHTTHHNIESHVAQVMYCVCTCNGFLPVAVHTTHHTSCVHFYTITENEPHSSNVDYIPVMLTNYTVQVVFTLYGKHCSNC